MASTSDKIGHTLAKGLLINLDYRQDASEDYARRQSITSGSSVESFVEKEPTTADWLREIVPTGRNVKTYFKELFPFLAWITRYNVQWLTGDLIAGRLLIPNFAEITDAKQVSRLGPLWSRRAWHMLYWRNFLPSTGSTLPLSDSFYTGHLLRPKISQSG